MLITRSNIPTLLRPGLFAVFSDWNVYPDMYKEIYQMYKSDKAVEYLMEMQTTGNAFLKQDGSPSEMSTMQQGYQTSAVNNWYSIAVQMSRGFIEDNLYENEFPQTAKQLRDSLENLRNINAMYQFNNAFNSNSTVSDGQPLASTAHPISTGTLANTFSNPVGLNTAALEDAITIIKQWQNLGGLTININPKSLLVPPKLQFQASRILNSAFQPDSGVNAINAIHHDKWFPNGVIVNPFLNNPYNWFILTDVPGSRRMFQRTPLEIDFILDPLTDNTTIRAVERYSFCIPNWRGVWCAAGAA